MNPQDAHKIAEYINTIEDPVRRREMHEYQNRLNGMLESLSHEERVEVICEMMKENVETLDELIKGLRDELG
jgi:hypothetical protein